MIVVLSGHWMTSDEEGWVTRQVAGALACVADVHVICPDGRRPRTRRDGVFTVHELGTPLSRVAEVRCDVLVEALGASSSGDDRTVPEAVEHALDEGLIEPWTTATDVLATLDPDLAVVAGHRNLGAIAAVDRYSPDLPLVLLALGHAGSIGALAHFDPVVERARAVMTVTEDERKEVVGQFGSADTVHRIGAPLAANSSVLVEPNTWVGDSGYLFVRTAMQSDDKSIEAELARLIRLRFDDQPVAVSYTDGLFVWHEGRLSRGWPVERSSDLARLMAWAQVTVDLHPGKLFARNCVESLLYGTPVIVPADSRAREYAQRGNGGLWFDGLAELCWCIEAVVGTAEGQKLGVQGRRYAETEFGSTDRFIHRVVSACGLPVDSELPDVASQLTPA